MLTALYQYARRNGFKQRLSFGDYEGEHAMASAAATSLPLAVAAPHPPPLAPPPPPPLPQASKIPRSRSANSLALFRTRSSGFEAQLEHDAAIEERGAGGIRRVGSYESALSDAAAPEPQPQPIASPTSKGISAASLTSDGSASAPHQQQQPPPTGNGKFARWLSRSIGPGHSAANLMTEHDQNRDDAASALASASGSRPSSATGPKTGRQRRSVSIGSLDLLTLKPSSNANLPAPSISISSSPATHPSTSSQIDRQSGASSAPASSTTVATASGSRRLNPLGGLRPASASGTTKPSLGTDSNSGGATAKKRFGGKRSKSSGATLNGAQPADGATTAELRISSSRSSSASGSTTTTTTTTTTTSGSLGRSSAGSANRDPFAPSTSTSTSMAADGAAEGRLARGLRKTRSGLRLFGRAKEQEPNSGAPAVSLSTSTVERTRSSSDRPSIGSTESLASASTATGDATSIRDSQPPLASSNRIGGWFTSLMPNANANPESGSPEKVRRAAAGQGTPSRNRGGSAPAAAAAAAGGGSPTPASPARRTGPASSSSPLKKGSSSSAASIGGGSGGGRLGPFDRMLDRAVQYFLDSDAKTDRCEEDIWLLGVRHDGWREDAVDEEGFAGGKGNRSPVKARSPPFPTHGEEDDVFAAPASPSSSAALTRINGWPSAFYRDFYSRIGLTYRSDFPLIECEPPTSPSNGAGGVVHGMLSNLSMSIGRGAQRFANVTSTSIADSSEPRGLTSDAGWGCMLRTGQSLLANALVKVHLGRDWRRPLPAPLNAFPSSIPNAATYARILSLFLDDPSPLSPFSVHGFARQGKQLGKEIGEWFGPSTAAGAIKALVNAYEPAGLRVVSCVDGTVYESEVVEASLVDGQPWKRPVLILVNVRLGLEGVNPIYHEAVKGIFRFPQSVGIAGGRPISSYYFVGSQADSLFYVDPHFPRPAVPLVLPADSDLIDSFSSVPISSSHIDARIGEFLLRAYPDSEWATYHCDKVRKVALGNLDPSMLLGFVIENEADWSDFRARVLELSAKTATMFTIAASPPAWLRRSASSSHAARVGTTARTSIDDSFSVVGETDRDGNDEINSDGFSEPDDWELQSTDDEAMQSSAVQERPASSQPNSALSRSPDDLVIVN